MPQISLHRTGLSRAETTEFKTVKTKQQNLNLPCLRDKQSLDFSAAKPSRAEDARVNDRLGNLFCRFTLNWFLALFSLAFLDGFLSISLILLQSSSASLALSPSTCLGEKQSLAGSERMSEKQPTSSQISSSSASFEQDLSGHSCQFNFTFLTSFHAFFTLSALA